MIHLEPCDTYESAVYYYSKKDNKEYILFLPPYMNRKLHRYDVATNKWNKIGDTLSNNFITRAAGTVIDPINDELIIFHGLTNVFGIFDLKNEKWKVTKTNNGCSK